MGDLPMTIIKATCPTCGDVELAPDQLRFVVSSVSDRSFYAFTCQDCGDRVRKHANAEVVRLLTVGGVVPERLDVPAEALEPHGGPALSWDDLLDFAAWLAEDEDLIVAVTTADRSLSA